jgi:uncharacterized protein YqgV (UPF0045/DUF77 family)
MPVMEIAIEPVGGDAHMHDLVSRAVSVVEQSGLPYRVGPMSTVVQGSLGELLALAERMHHRAWEGEDVPRILTTIRIDETRGAEKPLDDRVKIVVESVQHPG